MKPLKNWDELPDIMRTDAVRPYYDNLKKHEKKLILKRAFDVAAAWILLIVLAPIMLVTGICIKLDSPGPVFFRQTRITQYGKEFRIFKFRSMVDHADRTGSLVAVADDARVTKVGSVIRKYRIDEFPQLFNVLAGDMSFVGTRPEVPEFVSKYTDEMYATLLLPAGITSEASIRYKDEEARLAASEHADETYVSEVLPQKMKWNLDEIRSFSLISEVLAMIRTLTAVMR